MGARQTVYYHESLHWRCLSAKFNKACRYRLSKDANRCLGFRHGHFSFPTCLRCDRSPEIYSERREMQDTGGPFTRARSKPTMLPLRNSGSSSINRSSLAHRPRGASPDDIQAGRLSRSHVNVQLLQRREHVCASVGRSVGIKSGGHRDAANDLLVRAAQHCDPIQTALQIVRLDGLVGVVLQLLHG